MRTQIAAALASLSQPSISQQSAAVLSQLTALPAFTTCTSASIYLPMDGGPEIDTWPIVENLLARGCQVAVPKVCGKQPTDMRMLRLASLEQARAFPRTKWGIPEPDVPTQSTMEDATEASDLHVLFVPGMAFDARCGRLGHGRGYYDAFIARQRAIARGAGLSPLTVIGLALREQVRHLPTSPPSMASSPSSNNHRPGSARTDCRRCANGGGARPAPRLCGHSGRTTRLFLRCRCRWVISHNLPQSPPLSHSLPAFFRFFSLHATLALA